MSVQIPLKKSKGQIVPFGVGDTVPVDLIPAENITDPQENKDVSTIDIGQPMASHPSGTGFVFADADTVGTQAVGIATSTKAPAQTVAAQTAGVFALADWTNVAGTITLAPRTTYYLSTAAGKITATAPSSPGQVVQQIGLSISPTELDLRISQPILL